MRALAWAEAYVMLGEALGLWRGEPLADIPSQLLRRMRHHGLEQLHLQALEWRIEAELQLSRHAELMPALQYLAARIRCGNNSIPAHARPVPLRPPGRGPRRLPACPRRPGHELGTEPGPGCGNCTSRSSPPIPPWPYRTAVPLAAGRRRAGRAAGTAGHGGGISPAARPNWLR